MSRPGQPSYGVQPSSGAPSQSQEESQSAPVSAFQRFKRRTTTMLPSIRKRTSVRKRDANAEKLKASAEPRKLTEAEIDATNTEIRLPLTLDEILDKPDTFAPVEGGMFTALEIHTSRNADARHASPQQLTKEQLHSWLAKPLAVPEGWRTWGMKLVICPQAEGKTANSFPLAVERNTWLHICEAFGLPKRLTATIRDHNSRFMRFFEDDETEGFVLHDRHPGFSYSTIYNYKQRMSYGVVFGLPKSDSLIVSDGIRTAQEYLSCWPPVLVGMCLLERKAAWIDDMSTRSYMALQRIEKEIGTFSDYFLQRAKQNPEWLMKLKTQDIVIDLTIITTNTAKSDHLCRNVKGMLLVMEDAYSDYLKRLEEFKDSELGARPPGASPLPSPMHSSQQLTKPGFDTSANRQLRTRIGELKSYIDVLADECNFYSLRAAGNRQTVYSLIAQKDNKFSFDMQKASMTQTLHMRRIAELNVRDSAAMVIISVVTVIFLPGTFVSSLFSTTIFNFQPGGETNDYWHGIYWAVTAPLTIVILFLSLILWNYRKKVEDAKAKEYEDGLKKELRLNDTYEDYMEGAEPLEEVPEVDAPDPRRKSIISLIHKRPSMKHLEEETMGGAEKNPGLLV